jgi:hypothetical protein
MKVSDSLVAGGTFLTVDTLDIARQTGENVVSSVGNLDTGAAVTTVLVAVAAPVLKDVLYKAVTWLVGLIFKRK